MKQKEISTNNKLEHLHYICLCILDILLRFPKMQRHWISIIYKYIKYGRLSCKARIDFVASSCILLCVATGKMCLLNLNLRRVYVQKSGQCQNCFKNVFTLLIKYCFSLLINYGSSWRHLCDKKDNLLKMCFT